MIIGLVGRKRTGKSETAKYLADKYNIPTFSFSAPLKKIVTDISGLTDKDKDNHNYYDGKVFDLTPLTKELRKFKYDQLTPEEIDHLKALEYFKISEIYRNLMQYIGTNIFRKRNEYHWITCFKQDHVTSHSYIIEDIRFINEFLYVNSLPNSYIVKVTRRNIYSSDDHVSETEQEKIKCKHRLPNDGSINDLYNSIDKLFNIK